MLTIQYFVSSQPTQPAEATPPLPPENCPFSGPPRRRRRLRLYLVGSETDTQQTIDYLHTGGRIDRIEWTKQSIEVPDNGILIRRDPGDVLRYLQRQRSFD